MRYLAGIILIFIWVIGCARPFSELPETATASPSKDQKPNTSVVFIAGYDQGKNTYYTNAKTYFEGKNMTVVDNRYSLKEIIQWLNENSDISTNFNEIHIVSHSNPWLGMALKTTKEGQRIAEATLEDARAKKRIPTLKKGIGTETKIIFHACGLGENRELMQALKQVFTGVHAPKIIASPFFNVFGGKYAGHYLAEPYYHFYPTAESPGPLALSKEFEQKYPGTPIDWFSALKNRQETTYGKEYSYRFNIPVEWEFVFDSKAEIPQLVHRESIMDWVSESDEMARTLYQLNIPLEKYRWRSEINENSLVIKGKATVLCILQPILDQSSKEYKKPLTDDMNLYEML